VEKQIVIIFAGTNGYLDQVPESELGRYESELYAFMESKHPDIFSDLVSRKAMDDDLTDRLKKALEEFNRLFTV
jgi:F-type H+-transporting ATPase subunit alpha